MGHRLSKLYTRTGDDGSTGLGDGTRIGKDSARIEAIGTVDELNSLIGMLRVDCTDQAIDQVLSEVQHVLFDLGGELSVPGYRRIKAETVSALEKTLDQFNETLPPLKEFILPGGGRAAACCHLARTVCRRAERRLVTLSHGESINIDGLHYVNRLSDLLFVFGRLLARQEGGSEVLWRNQA